jgi:LAO/AO transport system kinase
MQDTGELHRRRQARAAREIEAIALAALREKMDHVRGSAALQVQAEKVANGELDPYAAADDLIEAVTA